MLSIAQAGDDVIGCPSGRRSPACLILGSPALGEHLVAGRLHIAASSQARLCSTDRMASQPTAAERASANGHPGAVERGLRPSFAAMAESMTFSIRPLPE